MQMILNHNHATTYMIAYLAPYHFNLLLFHLENPNILLGKAVLVSHKNTTTLITNSLEINAVIRQRLLCRHHIPTQRTLYDTSNKSETITPNCDQIKIKVIRNHSRQRRKETTAFCASITRKRLISRYACFVHA